jgi:MFS family permease
VAFGLFSTSLGLVSLPAPVIGGFLWENVNPQFPFLLTAFASLLAIIPAWFKFKVSGDMPDNEAVPGDAGKIE